MGRASVRPPLLIQKQYFMKPLATLSLLLSSLLLFAQHNHDHTWLLGSQGNPPTPQNPRFGINIMDFNNSDLTIDRDYFEYETYITNSSMSSAGGELLFFSNGCNVFNADYEIMENGTGLNPGSAYSSGNCPSNGSAVSNGMMALPLPGNEISYYIFHNATETGTGVFNPYVAKLYVSLVDMEKNNGLGAVTDKNVTVIADTLASPIQAVKHENGTDWWVVLGSSNSNRYFKVFFTENGVEQIDTQRIGGIPNPFYDGGSQSCFSPDGTMYARYVAEQGVYLFDFDRSSGELSNYRELYFVDTIPTGTFGGLALSSNSRFLYVCNTINLWQFDLQAADIQASRTVVGEYDGYKYLDLFRTLFFNMRLAPDCKIYMPSLNGSNIFHVIHSPNEPGAACDFRQHEFVLPAVNSASIPNFPNYRLDTPYPVCDSTIQLVTSSSSVQAPNTKVMVWPNPASGQVSVKLPYLVKGKAVWRLFNQVGQVVEMEELANGQWPTEISVASLPDGIYFWEVALDARRLDSGKLIISK